MIIWPLLKAATIVYPFVTMAAKPTRFVKKCKHSYVNEVIVQYNTNCQIFLRNSRGKKFCTLSKNVTKNCLVHSSQGTNKCSHEQRFSIQLNRFRIPNSKLEKIDQLYKQMNKIFRRFDNSARSKWWTIVHQNEDKVYVYIWRWTSQQYI
jgi:hypothetical protein